MVRRVLAPRELAGPPLQQTVGPFDIVRTQSKAFTKDAHSLFDRPNMHYAVIPEGYLSIYRSAELVVTNRVHTCAATLVLGGRARYLTTPGRSLDGRWQLLERVGMGRVQSESLAMEQGALDDEKAQLRAFLSDQLAAVL